MTNEALMTEAELLEQIRRDLYALHQCPPISVKLNGISAWHIFSYLQLALRHPEAGGDSADCVRTFARELQKHIAITDSLAKIAEMNWRDD